MGQIGTTLKKTFSPSGFRQMGQAIPEGVKTWVNKDSRDKALTTISKGLETVRGDTERQLTDVYGSAGGLLSKTAFGLMDALPAGKLAQETVKKLANKDYGGAVKGAYSGAKDNEAMQNVNARDLAKTVFENVKKPSGPTSRTDKIDALVS